MKNIIFNSEARDYFKPLVETFARGGFIPSAYHEPDPRSNITSQVIVLELEQEESAIKMDNQYVEDLWEEAKKRSYWSQFPFGGYKDVEFRFYAGSGRITLTQNF